MAASITRATALPRAFVVVAAAAIGSCTQGVAPAVGGGAADRGAQLFSGSCSACHQADGHGMTNVYPSLAGSALALGDPAALARWVIKGERPPSMPPGRYASLMPAFGWLKDADAAALLTYVRSNFGNRASAVDAATVAHAVGRP
jgi:mono/diheme cytochrome c family protein